MNLTVQKELSECESRGDFMRYARQSRGYSLIGLESASGINTATVNSWENGKVDPRLDVIEIICDSLKISIDEYIFGSSEEYPPIKPKKSLPDFGDYMRFCRYSKGLSVMELARRSGVCDNSIYGYESSRTRPKITQLVKLATALGVTIDDYVGHEAKI